MAPAQLTCPDGPVTGEALERLSYLLLISTHCERHSGAGKASLQ